jgi:hypothetical protein
MLTHSKPKVILMRTMYGSVSTQLRVPDALTVGTGKQTYRDPSFKPPSSWHLGFASLSFDSDGKMILAQVSEVPRLVVPNDDANWDTTSSTEYVSNKLDLQWAKATGDSDFGANYIMFFDAPVAGVTTGTFISPGTPWEGVPIPSLMYFSTGQRVTITAGSLKIYVETPLQ